MSDLASLNVKIDRTVKKDADYVANAMGMTLSTAINIFVRQMVSERAIPFKVHMVDNETAQFHKLLDDMRAAAAERDFMSDDEINAEIQAARAEMKVQGS
ncbi:MAG: type II toxin-antitoxin system RelB/DinJ family antitoxin [Defluviitaleaceae bacterium]|nr:type II toxin-antitoxin system RelB/DinJ family antitoxin [Defluviitaleaceae bacterium]